MSNNYKSDFKVTLIPICPICKGSGKTLDDKEVCPECFGCGYVR